MLIIGHGVFFYVMRKEPQLFPTAKIQKKRQTTKPFNKDLNNLRLMLFAALQMYEIGRMYKL